MPTSIISNVITDASGTPLAGVPVIITLVPHAAFRVSDSSEVAPRQTVTTDTTGTWSMALERNSNITPADSFYDVEEQLPTTQGGPRHWAIQVGDADATLRASLIPVSRPVTTSGGSSDGWTQGGNSFGATGVLGTNDNFGVRFRTNGTDRIHIDASGNVSVGQLNPAAQLHVEPQSLDKLGVLFKAIAAATANLLELRDSSGNSRLSVSGDGSALTFAFAPVEAGKMLLTDLGSSPGVAGVTEADPNAWWRLFRSDGAGYISRNASFNHSLQQWDRDDTSLSANLVEFGAGTWAVYIAPVGANPIRWATMIGCELTLGLAGDPVLLLPQHTKVGSTASKVAINGLLEVIPTDDKVALFLKGEPSLNNNIITAQRADTGEVAFTVGPGGAVTVGTQQTELSLSYSTSNGGGVVRFGKANDAFGNPGANLLFLYVRDGTNPNTLRLVVRAGESGVETTLLDNIPT